MARIGKTPLVLCVAAAAMTTALVGCSSGSSTAKGQTDTTETIILPPPPTTTSTLPPLPPTPAQTAANRKYLLGAGAKLLTFETETKPLVTPTNPTQFTCDELKRKTLPKLGGPGTLIALAAKVPDRTLAYLFDRDVRTKNLLVQACSQFGVKLDPVPMKYTRDQTASLFHRLGQFGITP